MCRLSQGDLGLILTVFVKMATFAELARPIIITQLGRPRHWTIVCFDSNPISNIPRICLPSSLYNGSGDIFRNPLPSRLTHYNCERLYPDACALKIQHWLPRQLPSTHQRWHVAQDAVLPSATPVITPIPDLTQLSKTPPSWRLLTSPAKKDVVLQRQSGRSPKFRSKQRQTQPATSAHARVRAVVEQARQAYLQAVPRKPSQAKSAGRPAVPRTDVLQPNLPRRAVVALLHVARAKRLPASRPSRWRRATRVKTRAALSKRQQSFNDEVQAPSVRTHAVPRRKRQRTKRSQTAAEESHRPAAMSPVWTDSRLESATTKSPALVSVENPDIEPQATSPC